MQFFFAYKLSKKLSHLKVMSPLLDATKGYLLYFAIHSLVTGRFAHYSEVSFLFIALMFCIHFEAKRNIVLLAILEEKKKAV